MVEIKVLDKGFVRYVDHMGSDSAIAESARVSYGKGTKSVSEDRTLIRHLMRCRHTSPFEMCEVKLHCKLPIFAARQMVRHRTACLSGETLLYFDLPEGRSNDESSFRRYNIKVKDFYSRWVDGTSSTIYPLKKPANIDNIDPDHLYSVAELALLVDRDPIGIRTCIRSKALKSCKVSNKYHVLGKDWIDYTQTPRIWKVNMKERLSKMKLRSVNESTSEIIHTNVADIWESGVKDTFQIELEGGYTITTSKDHLFYTDIGWLKLNQILQIQDNNNISYINDIKVATNGVECYKDRDWLNLKYWTENKTLLEISEEANISISSIRKYLKIHKLQDSTRSKCRFKKGFKPWNTGKTYSFNLTTEQHLKRSEILSKSCRRGSKCNLWKGGVSTERALIARWTRDQSHTVFKKYGFKCALSGRPGKFHAHHLDPVWNNPNLAYDFNNLICLNKEIHCKLHSNNLELQLLNWVTDGKPLNEFLSFYNLDEFIERPAGKKKPTTTKLVITYNKIIKAKYVGQEMTYDLEVTGDFHNFIANGIVVHNSINEISGRYSEMKDECYVPEETVFTKQNPNNKQGGTDEIITLHNCNNPDDFVDAGFGTEMYDTTEHPWSWGDLFKKEQEQIFNNYTRILNTKCRRELARINLPLATFTEWYFKLDLHNLMHFLKLRLSEHAQYETRVYAQAILEIVKPLFPITIEAFEDYVLNAQTLTRLDMDCLYASMSEEDRSKYLLSLTEKAESMFTNKRERQEFVDKCSLFLKR